MRAKIAGLKPGSAITKIVRVAADRLYDAWIRDPNPGKCRCTRCAECAGCAVVANRCAACRNSGRFHQEVRTGPFDRAYSDFVATTAKEFEKMAAKIFRRRPLPDAVEQQDVMQDLHCEISRILRKYNPAKATVAAFLVWNAFARAKKETNKQRGKVHDHDASIHALVASSLLMTGDGGIESTEDCMDRLSLASDTAELDRQYEAMVDSKKQLKRVRSRLSEQDSRYVHRVVLHGGNIRATAFAMISAVEEMDMETRERAVARKTAKLISALKAAAIVWDEMEREQENEEIEAGNDEDRDEARDARRREERRERGSAAIGEAIRLRGHETNFTSSGAKRIADRRIGKRTNGSPIFILCA